MKKLFVLLLALTVVAGAAFAEDPALAIAGEVFGKVGLSNNGTDTFAESNTGFYLDFDWTDGVFGASAEMEVDYPDTATIPYFNYAYGFVNLFDGMVKLDMGNMYITSYRLRNTMLETMMGGAIVNDGFVVEVMPVEGLALAVNLPIPGGWLVADGKPLYTTKVDLALQEFDFFAKYKAEGIGTFYSSYQMTAANAGSLFNIGADLTMVENAQIQVGYNLTGIGAALPVNENVSKVYLLGSYTMDALKITEEVDLTFGSDAAYKMTWLSNTTIAYRPADIRFQLTARIYNITATDDIGYRVTPAVRFYKGANYVNVQFQFDGNTVTGSKAVWQLPVSYSFAF